DICLFVVRTLGNLAVAALVLGGLRKVGPVHLREDRVKIDAELQRHAVDHVDKVCGLLGDLGNVALIVVPPLKLTIQFIPLFPDEGLPKAHTIIPKSSTLSKVVGGVELLVELCYECLGTSHGIS